MSNGWPTVTLGEVLTQRKAFIRIDDLETYKRCRVQLHAQGVVLRDSVEGSEIKTKEQQICLAGDFLVAEIDAKVGGYGIVPPELEGAVVSSHYFLFDIDEAHLDRSFLNFFIRTPSFHEQVAAQGTTNYAAIRPSHVLGYTIPLPPLTEQRRIVARIEALAAKINEARGLRALAVEEAETLIKSAMSQTAQDLLTKYTPQKLEALTSFIGDMNHEMPSAVEQGIPFISPKDFAPNRTINFENAKRISQEDFDRLSLKCCPQRGDILMARYGTIGVARFVEDDRRFLASYSITVIRPNVNKVSGQYLHWMITSPYIQEQAITGIRGSGMADLGLKTIRQFDIPLPPLPEQRRIVVYLDSVQAKVDALKRLQAETAAELDALLPAVLDRAFKGEL